MDLEKKSARFNDCVLTGATIEHFMSLASFFYDRYKQAQICGWHIDSVYGYLVTTLFPHIFAVFPYNPLSGVVVIYLNISLTFVWSFIDLIIMAVSLCLATRFKQINERLELMKGLVSFFS